MEKEEITVTRTCYECRGKAEGRRENYMYSECGLNNVVLKDVMVYRCRRCGANSVEIPNMDGLHRTIGMALLCKKSMLRHDEVRFLRTVAGMTATELAKRMGVTKTAVSRWENGVKKIGRQSDRSIRTTCGLAILEEIVVGNSGPIHDESVTETLNVLKRFLAEFTPTLPMITEEAHDSDKMVIDPELLSGVSIMNPLAQTELTQ
jgi:YgiT-type zinc finger domain-containing protein